MTVRVRRLLVAAAVLAAALPAGPAAAAPLPIWDLLLPKSYDICTYRYNEETQQWEKEVCIPVGKDAILRIIT